MSIIDELRARVKAFEVVCDQLRAESHTTRQILVDVTEERDQWRAENAKLRAETETLRSVALELRAYAGCEDVNHRAGEFHGADEPCRVLARIDAVLRGESGNG